MAIEVERFQAAEMDLRDARTVFCAIWKGIDMSNLVLYTFTVFIVVFLVIGVWGSIMHENEYKERCEAAGGFYEFNRVMFCWREDGTRIFLKVD